MKLKSAVRHPSNQPHPALRLQLAKQMGMRYRTNKNYMHVQGCRMLQHIEPLLNESAWRFGCPADPDPGLGPPLRGGACRSHQTTGPARFQGEAWGRRLQAMQRTEPLLLGGVPEGLRHRGLQCMREDPPNNQMFPEVPSSTPCFKTVMLHVTDTVISSGEDQVVQPDPGLH